MKYLFLDAKFKEIRFKATKFNMMLNGCIFYSYTHLHGVIIKHGDKLYFATNETYPK
jgi:hypothetical protein